VPGVSLVAGEEGGDLGVLFFEPVTHVRLDNARAYEGLPEVGLVAGERGDVGAGQRDVATGQRLAVGQAGRQGLSVPSWRWHSARSGL
jgi:hypothetical protein